MYITLTHRSLTNISPFFSLKTIVYWDIWLAQSVKHLPSAQVIIKGILG